MLKSIDIHHIGYAVFDIEKAQQQFSLFGFVIKGEVCHDVSRNVLILFMEKQSYVIELVAILDKIVYSPIDFIFKSKSKPIANIIPYHICYEVSDIDFEVERLRKEKFILTIPKMPAPAIGGKNVVFMLNKQMGLIELLEK